MKGLKTVFRGSCSEWSACRHRIKVRDDTGELNIKEIARLITFEKEDEDYLEIISSFPTPLLIEALELILTKLKSLNSE